MCCLTTDRWNRSGDGQTVGGRQRWNGGRTARGCTESDLEGELGDRRIDAVSQFVIVVELHPKI